MTIKDCIDIVDNAKPNQYSVKDKVAWLSFIEHIIINDVLKTHEGYDGRYDDFEGYSEEKLSVPLIVEAPYNSLYIAYLKMMIDKENGETARYNNSASAYNTYMLEYKKHYNKTHMPLQVGRSIKATKPIRAIEGMTEAQLESVKNELAFILKEHFADVISDDKVYDIVMKYVQNNADMLKGKDGKTPIVGQDFWTDADIRSITEEVIASLKADIEHLVTKHSYSKAEVDAGLNSKADKDDVYDKAKIDDEIRQIETAWKVLSEGKVRVGTVYTKKEVDDKLETKVEKEFVDDMVEAMGNIVDTILLCENTNFRQKVIDESSNHNTYPSTKAVYDLVSRNYCRQKINLKDVVTIANNYSESDIPDIGSDYLSAENAAFDINVDGFIKFKCTTDNYCKITINGEEKIFTHNDGEFHFESVVKGKITIICNLSSVIFTEFYKLTGDVADALGAVHTALDEILAIKAKLWGDVE